MHLYSLGFIFALLAFGGIAAYLGDVLGYRLGKRRLSLLRLRPRTTARLVGILAGILIPAVTVLVGYWQIDYVRVALTQLDDIHQELTTLRSSRETLQRQRDELFSQRNELRQSVDEAQTEAADSRDALAGVQENLDRARGLLDVAQDRVGRLRNESGRLRSDRDRVSHDLEQTSAMLETANQALTAADEALTAANHELGELQTDKTALQDQVATLQQQSESLQAKIKAIEAEWEQQHSLFAGSVPALDLGTELVRGVVERPGDLDSLKNELVALLVLADQAGEAGGAARGDNDRFVRAVGPVPLDAIPEGGGFPPESRVLGYVVRQLWDAPEPSQVVQIVVTRRTFPGEQALVAYVARPNRLAFRKGQAIVARQVPAGVNEAEAFEQLWRLIADPEQSEVRKQARAAGMLPDPASGRYGQVGVKELFRAAKECAGQSSPVRVLVEAAEDTYTAGPLLIRITVGSADRG